jgi:hypothetical protein
MSRKQKIVLTAFLAFAFSSVIWAQFVTSVVQQGPTMLNVATKVANANAAVANQVTATMTPASSNYVYLTGIDLEVCQDATGLAQTNVNWTTTGITGLISTAPIWSYSTALAADVCIYKVISYPTPLKSTTPGSAVTVVSPASDAHAAYTINVFWYEAP